MSRLFWIFPFREKYDTCRINAIIITVIDNMDINMNPSLIVHQTLLLFICSLIEYRHFDNIILVVTRSVVRLPDACSPGTVPPVRDATDVQSFMIVCI